MNKLFINRLHISLLLLSMSVSTVFNVNAAKIDLQQEISIDASRQAADLKNKIFSYIDNVVIKQGSLVINADLVQVITATETDTKTYIAQGKPATFKQTLEDGTHIYLQADEIKYEPAKNTVTISGNAELRQEGSKVNGSVITYNFLTEQVLAKSENDQRVKTVLQPKQLEEKNP
ncbi:lipopolysaccharide transport periplasmic protein LptA [Thalassotalea hakodatensis]|uniref:lipopolysaccharide transport periplasmic protein LptA n=1 Tax=Thalassotalea hakodatensis TaxID=3030492 RepID=UPI002572379C|nr:lipopolysaccharide transport periplasmic protein LptA [Thalassotalea hakodatensis]